MTTHPSLGAVGDDRDQIVLDLRSTGRSFAFIARTLNIGEATDAFAAFLRAVDQSPAGDRGRLRDEELNRLETLEAAIRLEGALSPFDFDRRLAQVRQLRGQLATGRAPLSLTPQGT